MSYFLPPIANTRPAGSCTVADLYRWITGDERLKATTLELRSLVAAGMTAEYRHLKQWKLPFVTPHGVFTYRRGDSLVSPSGLVVVDIDHLARTDEAERLRDQLFADPYLQARLAFVSPGGRGVKLFLPGLGDAVGWAMSYIRLLYADTLGGEVDTSGKDIARCCFLSHDPNARARELEDL